MDERPVLNQVAPRLGPAAELDFGTEEIPDLQDVTIEDLQNGDRRGRALFEVESKFDLLPAGVDPDLIVDSLVVVIDLEQVTESPGMESLQVSGQLPAQDRR